MAETRSPQALLWGLIVGTVLAALFLGMLPLGGLLSLIVAALNGAFFGLALRVIRVMNTGLPGFMRSSMLTFNIIVVGLVLLGLALELQPALLPLIVWFLAVAAVNLTVPNDTIIRRLDTLFPNLEFSDPDVTQG
jgi:hypothetical protein